MEQHELNKLRWHCTRRALLELDITLGRFLDNGFNRLNETQVKTFIDLVAMEDHDLWALISGKVESADPLECEVIAAIRKH
jgi:succinate dehydrogenase flavin-adding protein (antitoxin of CptAB toxin-antitoxin module)